LLLLESFVKYVRDYNEVRQFGKQKYYAFGDESGDLGFALRGGSSTHYIVLLYVTNEPITMEKEIAQLRRELHWPSHVEFRFSKTSDKNRRAFLAAIQPYPFIAYTVVVNKAELSSNWHKLPDSTLYALFLADLAQRLPANIVANTSLFLDQFGAPKTTLHEVRRMFKGLAQQPFRRVNMTRSKGNDLLQCADMLAGAVAREVNEQDGRFLDIVRHKVMIWHFETNKNPPG
jgi:hypothetical protein